MDGVAGVEAQTEKVWKQANNYNIPRIAYVNKLDRVGAAFGRTVKEIGLKLGAYPIVCQLPYFAGPKGEEVFRGVVDLVSKKFFLWPEKSDGRNAEVHDFEWLKTNLPDLHKETETARAALEEALTSIDENLISIYLETGEMTEQNLKESLRKLVINGSGKGYLVPVFCGSSFRNIGVQPLLDSVVDFLPSPAEIPPIAISYPGEEIAEGEEAKTEVLKVKPEFLCALAFKVVNDAKRGPMVYVRVYSGMVLFFRVANQTDTDRDLTTGICSLRYKSRDQRKSFSTIKNVRR